MTTLTTEQRRRAETFNRRVAVEHPHRDEHVRALRTAVGLGAAGELDGDFAQALADWQERHPTSVAGRRFDGLLRPRTEAHMGIRLDEMERLAQRVEDYWRAGGEFYDSWGNDGRDNDLDGLIDEPDERAPDGAHYDRVYQGFDIAESGGDDRTRVVAPAGGDYRYRFCSDIVARALRDTGIVRGGYARVFHFNGGALDRVAYKFVRSSDYPERYLRGDIIGHNDLPASQGGHGGHIGIVVQDDDTDGGATAPMVIDLPGPTYLRTASFYRPNGEHADGRPPGVRGDVVRERWPSFRINEIDSRRQFLIRLVCTLLHRTGRRPTLPRTTARG